MSTRRRITEGLREPFDLIADLYRTETRWGLTAAIAATPLLLAIAFVAAWVAGVLAIGAIGAVIRTDILGRTDDLPKGIQAAIYVATSTGLLYLAHAATVLADAISRERTDRELQANAERMRRR